MSMSMDQPMDRTTARQILARAGLNIIGPNNAPWRSSPQNVAGVRSGGPPAIPEPATRPYFDHHPEVLIDRYAVNPGVQFVQATVPSNLFSGPAPTMFSSGDLPIFTASGIDVDQLLWVPWKLRHAAAMTPSRARALGMVEEGDYPEHLQTREGAAALAAYFGRVTEWAMTPEPLADPNADTSHLFRPTP